jgi:hypothetical protein
MIFIVQVPEGDVWQWIRLQEVDSGQRRRRRRRVDDHAEVGRRHAVGESLVPVPGLRGGAESGGKFEISQFVKTVGPNEGPTAEF